MKQKEQILMHSKITKHSNLMIPFSDHVTVLGFPEQNKQLLNTIVTLQYRNRYIADKEAVNIPSSGRPKDDISFIEAGIHDGDGNIIFSNNFRILRADITEPYKYIAISTDYKYIIVGKMSEDGEIDKEIYPVTMFQMSEYIGLQTTNMYVGKLELTEAVVLALDNGEPCNAVIMEYIDKDTKTVRFVLGDECFSVIIGYIDTDFNFKELNTLEDLRGYNMNRSITDISNLREYLLSDITIYGSEKVSKTETEKEVTDTDEEISN